MVAYYRDYRDDLGNDLRLEETYPARYVENWVFIDSDGDTLASRPPKPSSSFVNGLAKTEERHELLSHSSKDKYDDDDGYGYGYYTTYYSLVGFINIEGEVIIPIQYEPQYVGDYRDGLIRVRVDSKYGYINQCRLVKARLNA